jgi:hypothetical protein
MIEKTVDLFIDKNQTSFVTDIFSGNLNSIIIISNNKTDVIIESAIGYLVMKDKEMIGTNYICPRQRTQAPEKSLFDVPQHTEFLLNEPLIITVSGPKNTAIRFIFRLD